MEQYRFIQKNFIGPSSDAIRKMGSKSKSKQIMQKANVPVVPGYHQNQQNKQLQSYLIRLFQKAKQIGFPLLIKAIMGGGGKGMRIVWKPQSFFEALESCQRQSLKSFKDSNVLIEKFITKPKHIEVQIFGDKFGNYVHLFQRDCSIQRRHQKIIQQAPSNITQNLRIQICQSAIAAAKAVNYYNAGTIQFIFDLEKQKYYFMEMNTRLQVEHPISEMITGQDFVRWQLLVASGHPLPKTQQQIKKKGHAIQSRIYSEDPFNMFLPANGKIKYLKQPQQNETVRIQTGIRQNDQISIFYDPMISKLITYGQTRQQSLQTMKKSLRQYKIIGLPTNINFLERVCNNKNFQNSHYDTTFIQINESLLEKFNQVENDQWLAAICCRYLKKPEKLNFPVELMNFRNNYKKSIRLKISVMAPFLKQKIQVNFYNQKQFELIFNHHNQVVVRIEQKSYKISAQFTKDQISIILNQNILKRNYFRDGQTIVIINNTNNYTFVFQSNLFQETQKQEIKNKLFKVSPMPGTLTKLFVKQGDIVEKDTSLLIIQAMKMEHILRSEDKLRIRNVYCKQGEFVKGDQILIELQQIN